MIPRVIGMSRKAYLEHLPREERHSFERTMASREGFRASSPEKSKDDGIWRQVRVAVEELRTLVAKSSNSLQDRSAIVLAANSVQTLLASTETSPSIAAEIRSEMTVIMALQELSPKSAMRAEYLRLVEIN